MLLLVGIFDYIDTEFSIDSPKGEMHVSDLKHAFAFLGFDVRAPLVSTVQSSWSKLLCMATSICFGL